MLARKSFLIFAANLFGAILGLASLFFIGRYMTPASYGMVGFALGLLGLASFVTKIGFAKAHIKRISDGVDVRACNGTFIPITLALTFLFVVGSLAFILIRHYTVGWIAATALPVLLIMVGYYALMALRKIPETTLDALRLTASTQTMTVLENLLRTPFIIIAAMIFGFLRGRDVPLSTIPSVLADLFGFQQPMTDVQGAVMIAAAYTFAMLVSLVCGFWLMRRHGLGVGRFDPALARSYVAFGLPVGVYRALRTMMYHLDNVMIGYFWTATEVGFYFAAQRILLVVKIIPTAISTIFFPMINELMAMKDWDAVREVALTTQRLMSLVLLPILLITVVYAHDLVRIFVGQAFLPTASALQFLVGAVTLSAFTTVASNMLLGMNRPGLVAAISLVGIFTNFTMNVILIPESILGVPLFGLRATGAAIATFIAKTVTLILLVIISRRMLGFTHVSKSSYKHIFAALLTAAVLLGVPHIWPELEVVRVWDLGIAVVFGLSLYVGTLLALGELTRKDILLFVDIMHPLRMGRYVRDELKSKRRSK